MLGLRAVDVDRAGAAVYYGANFFVLQLPVFLHSVELVACRVDR